MASPVVDAPDRSRFEMKVGDLVCIADYRLRGDHLAITHVETPPELRGAGHAAALMDGVVEIARARKLKIAPLCSYAAAYMRRHPELGDLLA
jgi:predicted GNAT family acetyltransferase